MYRKQLLQIIDALNEIVAMIPDEDAPVEDNPVKEPGVEPEPETPVEEPEPETPLPDNFLMTKGTKIVNQKGEEILLKGTNAGSLLTQEYWMCPVKGSDSIPKWRYNDTLKVLENRFGADKTLELITTYMTNWMNEWDAAKLSEFGCNVIRLPFVYRNFMKDADGTWLTDKLDENPGIIALDTILRVCEKYGIYVILDMHGCPGGQSVDHCTGGNGFELFTNTHYQDVMEELWVTLVERYKNNPTVAGYDIMNEPCDYSGKIENFNDLRNGVFDRMYKAIRKVDKNHIIIMEGIWGLGVLPTPEEAGWENIIYSTHNYSGSDKATIDSLVKSMARYGEQHNIPIYIGEFSNMLYANACKQYGVNFTNWTYKGTKEVDGDWYMYYTYKDIVDVYNDSFEQIKKKWGTTLQTANGFVENKTVTSIFKG